MVNFLNTLIKFHLIFKSPISSNSMCFAVWLCVCVCVCAMIDFSQRVCVAWQWNSPIRILYFPVSFLIRTPNFNFYSSLFSFYISNKFLKLRFCHLQASSHKPKFKSSLNVIEIVEIISNDTHVLDSSLSIFDDLIKVLMIWMINKKKKLRHISESGFSQGFKLAKRDDYF